MNTEQLKTDVTQFIISKGVDNRNIMGPSGYLQLDDLLTDFASQESKIAVSEFKDKLRRGLFRLDMYGPDNMVKMKEFEDLIDKL